MTAKREVRVGRIYDPPSGRDGTRVLVDRIWPRGVRKDKAALDEWCRQIAPSTDLRMWYGHDPAPPRLSLALRPSCHSEGDTVLRWVNPRLR